MPKQPPSILDWLRAWIAAFSSGIQPDMSPGAQAARSALELGGAIPDRPPSVTDWLRGAVEKLTGASPAQAAAARAGAGRQPQAPVTMAPGTTTLAGLASAQRAAGSTWNAEWARMARAAGLPGGNLSATSGMYRRVRATRRDTSRGRQFPEAGR